MIVRLQPADLIFYRTSSWLGKTIRWFTRSRKEEETYSNHVAGMINERELIEADFKAIRREINLPIELGRFQIWRNTFLTNEQRVAIANKAIEYQGKSYGYSKLITHMMDAFLNKIFSTEIFFFRKLNHIDNYPICSWIWTFPYFKAAKIKFGIEPEYATPDDMHDYIKKSYTWIKIYER